MYGEANRSGGNCQWKNSLLFSQVPKAGGIAKLCRTIWRSTRVNHDVEGKRRNLDLRVFILVSLGNNRCAKDL